MAQTPRAGPSTHSTRLRAGSEPFATLEDKLREGSQARMRKPRFFTSLRSVQNDRRERIPMYRDSDRLLIYPDTLLLQPFFQIAHFTIENLVVVVLFQLLDIAFQLRLLLHNIT